jgi:hypothetical protein
LFRYKAETFFEKSSAAYKQFGIKVEAMVNINHSTRGNTNDDLSPSSWRLSSLQYMQMLILLVVLIMLVDLKANLFFTDQIHLPSKQNSIGYVKQNSIGYVWQDIHTKILKEISLPKWNGKSKNNSESDRLGDIWLPPRLSIADDLRTLECGVLFSGTGPISYAEKYMVPMITYLRDNLGIPNANERSSMRKKGIYNRESKTGYALVTTKEFVNGPLKNLTSFFDAVYMVEDLPLYPFDWQLQIASEKFDKGVAKAIKVHAMSSAPFDTTLMLDFDSLPCHKDFIEPLLKVFSKSNADIGLTNVVKNKEKDARHFLIEHNSAVVMLNMTSIRTRVLLSLYIQAFHRARSEKMGGKQKKDQPALMIAMGAMVEKFHPQGTLLPNEVPNESVREVIETYDLDFIRHLDFDTSQVCRKRTETPSVCSVDSPCVIAHKEENTFLPRSREWKNAGTK